MERLRKKVQNYSQREQILLLFIVLLVIISFVLFIFLLVNKNNSSVCYTPECIEAAHHILNTVDQTVNPCEDFYKFSCGNFLKQAIAKNLVSPLKPLDEMKKNGLKQIIMEELESEDHLSKSFRYQRKFYRSCMNTTAIQEDKDKTFLAILKKVTGGWPLSQGYTEDLQWTEIMIRARENGMKFDYFLDVDIKYVHNESSVYLEIGPPPVTNFKKHFWKEANLQKIMDMAEYWGETTLSAVWELRKTIEFAKNLKEIVDNAHSAMQNMTLESEKTTISKLKNVPFLKLHWLQFLKNMTNMPNLKEKDVILLGASEDYFRDLYYLIQKTQTKFWVNYIVILLITDEYRFLSTKIETTCKDILDPSKHSPRSEFCFDGSTVEFEGVAESQYIRKVVTGEKRRHIKEIIKNIKFELKDSVKRAKWMDKETKESATEHLNKVTEFVGWTDIVFNETEFDKMFEIDKLNFESENIIKINQQLLKFYYDVRFRRIGTNSSNYFDVFLSIPLLEVNAVYIKYVNILILIAPILHPPIYGPNRPEYINYGSLGSIIGHELTHALSKVNDESHTLGIELVDYWTNETHVKYEEEAKCINEEYENYTGQLEGQFTNATETLIENSADFSGLNLAYQAYQKWVDRHGTEEQLPGIKYSPNQIFWIMASTYMCQEPKLQDFEKSHSYGRHAVASFRVVGPIRNSPYFGNDFGCAVGSGMNPKKKCGLFL